MIGCIRPTILKNQDGALSCKGARHEACRAQEQILHNRKNVSKRQEVAERLEEIKTELQSLADALDGIWKRGRENNPVSE